MVVRVLMIDDNEDFRGGAAGVLAGLPGVELVATAGSAAEGLAQVEAERPDLVLLDLRMPHGSGFEVLEKLGARRGVRIVVVSLYDEPEVQDAAFSLGAAGFLSKHHFTEGLPALVARLFPETAE